MGDFYTLIAKNVQTKQCKCCDVIWAHNGSSCWKELGPHLQWAPRAPAEQNSPYPQEPAQLQNWHRTYTQLWAGAGEVFFKSKMIFLPSWATVKTAPRKKNNYITWESVLIKSLVVDPVWIESVCSQQIPAFVHTGHRNKSLAKWGETGRPELYMP